MTVTIPIKAIQLTPGSAITIDNLKWQDFETILDELGEKRRVRLTYYQGNLEIMSPLAIHERPHRIIADIVKGILNLQGRDWEDFGSTTFKRPEIAGVEPDTCLYIQNAPQMRGCTHIDLDIYPPPDLAIESDVTSAEPTLREQKQPLRFMQPLVFLKYGFLANNNLKFTSSKMEIIKNSRSVQPFPIYP
ncbi:Uma2 family endonuclease [Moorena sp. SIO3I8]|uniref:Uma2 family endonuclease n=1 Tax=Moorena sp. SIO3I8 TaxID=2607833 RepID=UPI003420B15A